MKRLMLAAVLSGVVFAASAQTPVAEPEAPVATDTAVAVPVAAPDADRDDSVVAKTRPTERSCVQQTGSRIPNRNQAGKCNGEAGNSYTREELLGTGRVDIGDALRALDTSIR